MINILFICTGNTCRSPMAEYMAKTFADKLQLADKFNIKSCGLFACDNQSVNLKAVKVMENINNDISYHKSMKINSQLVNEADYIYVMDDVHLNIMKRIYGDDIYNKVKCICDSEIEDPYGMDLEDYEICRDKIKFSIQKIVNEIINNEKI